MANNKKFAVKNGVTTPNVDFLSPDETKTISATMLDSSTITFSGTSGQLFSITDSMTGVIFAVNDISGVPSIEVDDTGTIRFAELSGNVLIGTATNDGTSRLQVNGVAKATSFASTVATGTAPFAVTSTTKVTNLNADLLDGLDVHTGTNNEVNKIVRTDASGYIQAGWINTVSGDNGTTAIDRVYASSDGYIRYYTPANFRTVLNVPTRTGGDASGTWSINITGAAGSITNGVYTVGDQTIGGIKTFTSTIVGSINGNAGTVTNGVYTTGDQTIGGIKTFSSTIVGSVNGNAGTVTNGVYTTGNQSIAGIKTFTNNTASTNTTTGSVVVTGGVGVSGNVNVGGVLSAVSKSFLINHPTKPGWKLRYGSLEGPENGVYVRGRLKGLNIIELPDYWSELIDPDSITVNLTPAGKHQNLFVKSIENNQIIVDNSNLFGKDIDCFYIVYGERRDVGKLEVEAAK